MEYRVSEPNGNWAYVCSDWGKFSRAVEEVKYKYRKINYLSENVSLKVIRSRRVKDLSEVKHVQFIS